LNFSSFQMLRFLSIKRLAVIDAVEVEFDRGLNVLTGETGAGKSILVEAVGLLLGGRASGDLVRTGEESAAIEAIFETDGEEILVRREITAQGRSRAFVNGELATAGALKELSSKLVELHGQHEHHTLLDPATHLELLDDFAGLATLLTPVAAAHAELRDASQELAAATNAAAERESKLELARFQLAELDRIDPKPGEDTELAAIRQVLASAERVQTLCAESYVALYESDAAVLTTLSAVWKRVGELAAIDPQFQAHLEARDGIKSQLEDLAAFLRRYGEGIDASPQRLQQIEERLALLERLKRRFGPGLDEVIAKRAALKAEVDHFENVEERLASLHSRATAARRTYIDASSILARARRQAAIEFTKRLERLLADLALERTRFDVRFAADPVPEGEWSVRGFDRAEFFISTNPGEELRPLARVVSGGELSRVMLALKTLGATSRREFTDAGSRPPSAAAPGLIFDEVDAGIGGRVADVVGRKLCALGSAFQVLCITHLPQIAGYADTHFLISKRVTGGRTHTGIKRLDEPARVEELSRMLGGEVVTDTVRASATEMLARRGSGKRPQSESKSKGESERAKAKPGSGRTDGA
jgi:DNA repair protein RecN (Recombination protein N)